MPDAGVLKSALNSATLALFAGFTPGASQALWDPYDLDTSTFAWNAARVARATLTDAEWSRVFLFTELSGSNQSGLALTPTCALFATHSGPANAVAVSFLTAASTEEDGMFLGQADVTVADLSITVITQVSLTALPAWWLPTDWKARLGDLTGLFCLVTRHDRTITLMKILFDNGQTLSLVPMDAPYDVWSAVTIAGESSSPVFLPLGNQLVLLGVINQDSFGVGYARNAGVYLADLQAGAAGLGVPFTPAHAVWPF